MKPTPDEMRFGQELVNKASGFAFSKHKDQTRDGGGSYFWNHLWRVAAMSKIADPYNYNLHAAAYLHDTLEDTDVTYDELVKEFGQEIANLVLEVTHDGDKSTGFYFPRLKSKDAITLKFLDRAANIGDMSSWTEERQAHYLKKSKFWKDEEPK